MSTRRKALLAAAALLAIVLPVAFWLRGGPPAGSLVFVQVPAGAHSAEAKQPGSWPWLLPSDSRLVLLTPDAGKAHIKVLTKGFHAACDPSLSPDGSRLVFAGQRREGDEWQVWEMRAGGGRARRVLAFAGDCAGPIYVPENGDPSSPCYMPDQRVLFAGQARRGSAEPGAGHWQLFSCRRDGSDLTQLTYGMSPTYDPVMLPDGRVVFATWHWQHTSAVQSPVSALWHMQQDGTGADSLCPGPEGYLKRSPVAAQGRLFFVASDQANGAGSRLASIALNRPFTTYEVVSRDLEGEFQSAYPLGDGRLVVSDRPPQPGASFGLYEFDCAQGVLGRVIYDDPRFDEVDPAVVERRKPPHGHVTVIMPEATTGELYCLNVYESELTQVRALAPDGIQAVRVYEAAASRQGGKLLGEAPVEADGSFYLEVPANRPLQWELLDRNGEAAARSPVGVWVRPFEHRGCVGCHAPWQHAPNNFIPQAITRKPSAVGVKKKVEIVGFREKIMPMIEARCATAACHGPGGMGKPKFGAEPAQAPDGTTVNQAYANLVYTTDPVTGWPRWVYPGSARTSPLLMVMTKHARTDRVELGEEERQTLMKWIDGGAHWQLEGAQTPPAGRKPAGAYGGGG